MQNARGAPASAEPGSELVPCESLHTALAAIVNAAAAATGADLVVARMLEPGEGGHLAARAVTGSSAAWLAQVTGSRVEVDDLRSGEAATLETVSSGLRRLASRLDAAAVLQLPVLDGDSPVGSLELLRRGPAFSEQERVAARLAAGQFVLAQRAFAGEGAGGALPAPSTLELTGEALVAAFAADAGADQIVRLAAEAAGAAGALLWRVDDGELALVAWFGVPVTEQVLDEASSLATAALQWHEPVSAGSEGAGLWPGIVRTAGIKLGHPPLGLLQLGYASGEAPAADEIARLATFGARAAHALRSGHRARGQAQELERTQALLAIVGQAIARLSLAHTLETAVEQVTSLLGVERAAVYLREGGRLLAAAGRGLVGPHTRVAEGLLDLALGTFRARGFVAVEDAAKELRGRELRAAVADAGLDAAVALPLIAHEEVIGLLAIYPERGRVLSEHEASLLGPLADQLAVAVENARLHEQAKALGRELESALAAERQAARRLRALYEVSRSFTQSLSVDATLEAVARTAVENLGVDAAVLRAPDARGESLVTQAVHVADPRLEAVVSAMLSRAQVLSHSALQSLFHRGAPLMLDAGRAESLGGSFRLLVPFLEKGSTVVVVPVSTPAEVLATLTLISLDPGEPIGPDTVDIALTIASQAALALENAHLYQQQKRFSDAMQRSLLPRTKPAVSGLELGVVYESSSRMDVGGDVYDFLALPDGRLAVLLGDVAGHGIDAAADMAMAKFVFRSLVREHPEPGDFLAHANEVVAGELAVGKFVTLLYLVVDPVRGELASASAGHPQPRLVTADGGVRAVPAMGLALGIEPGQRYEEAREGLPVGSAVVLYTDGVLEARRDGDLYGAERLDAFLAHAARLPAQELAAELLAECRRFAGGDLGDDCAIVVVRNTG
ncbi:MAG: SpoIIE family protein phosphatase [Gaiellaceae bacterium]